MRLARLGLSAILAIALVNLVPPAAHADVPPPTYCSEWRVTPSTYRYRACIVYESSTRMGTQVSIQNLAGETRTTYVTVKQNVNGTAYTCYDNAALTLIGGATWIFSCWSVRVTGFKYYARGETEGGNINSPTKTG